MEDSADYGLALAEDARLSSEEKAQIRKALLVTMRSMRRTAAVTLPGPRPRLVEFLWNVFAASLRPLQVAALIVFLVLGSGGMTWAAESSLPGDWLYFVKLNVNEPIVASLMLSDEGAARWQTRRAERRLEEAETLAAHQQLPPDIEMQIADGFRDYAERARHSVDQLREAGDHEGAMSVGTEWETTLQAHASALEAVQHAEERVNRNPLQEQVDEAAESSGEARAAAERHITEEEPHRLTVPVQQTMEASAEKIDSVRTQILESSSSRAGTRADALEKLHNAEESLGEAWLTLSSGNPERASVLSRQALRSSREAELFLSLTTEETKEEVEEMVEEILEEALQPETEEELSQESSESSRVPSQTLPVIPDVLPVTPVTIPDLPMVDLEKILEDLLPEADIDAE